MHFTRAFLLLGMAMSASAMMTPHLASKLNHRRGHAVVARAIADEAAPVPHIPATVVPRKSKRANERRCKAKASSSSSSAEAAATTAVANAGGDVPTFASSSAEPATTEEPATTKAATTEKPATTKAATTKAATTEAPVTTKAAATTKTTSAAAATTAASSSGSGDLLTATHTGQATFYATGLGACGITNNDGDHIAAVSHLLFDTFPGYNGANPNNNPICNRKVTAHYQGKSTTVTITDRCEGCAMFDLDFSPTAFNELGLPAQGRLDGMTWTFN